MGRPSAMTAGQIRLAPRPADPAGQHRLLHRPAARRQPRRATIYKYVPPAPRRGPVSCGPIKGRRCCLAGRAPQGQGHNERPRHLDGGHQPLRQAQGGTALGFEDDPGQQGEEYGGHGPRAAGHQDQRLRRCPAGGEGRPYRDRGRAERGPGQVLRSRAANRLRRHRDADAGQARDHQHDPGRHPDARQARGGHEIARSHHEQGARHDPAAGSAEAGQPADRAADRAVGRRLERLRRQPAPDHDHR